MSGEWGHGDDDEMARLLKGALRREADLVEVPDRYETVRAAAHQAETRRAPWLFAVAAALVLVLGGGLLWQSGLLRGGGASTSAAAPAQAGQAEQDQAQTRATQPQAAPATPVSAATRTAPAPATSAAPTRTITGPTIAFASSTGNLVCYMSNSEVICQVLSPTAWEQAAPRTCPVIGGGTMPFAYNKGSVSMTSKGAALVCGGQGLVMVDLAQKNQATSWYQAGRDTTVTLAYGTAPVLPYGGVATTPNGQTCQMAPTGVTCTDPNGAALQLSRESLTMVTGETATPTVVRYVTSAASAAFATPTGRIVCLVTDSGAACEVSQPTYAPPAKPASCQLDWGSRIGLDAGGVGFVCAGDTIRQLPSDPTYGGWSDPRWPTTVSGAGVTLGYGSTLTVGSYTCRVETTGVTCTRQPSGKGFVIATQSYQLLP